MSELVFDLVAVVFLLVGLFAMAKVFRSMRRMPENWVGPYARFDRRIRKERKWTAVCWVFLILAVVVGAVHRM